MQPVSPIRRLSTKRGCCTGAPLGPFRILDIVGLTTAYNIVVLDPRTKDPDSVPAKIAAALKERIDAGKTGVDAGEGFYHNPFYETRFCARSSSANG